MTVIPEPQDRDTAASPASATEVGSRFLRYLPFITVAHFVIGLPALIASLALAYFAFVQADATQKMQTGGVMPFVTFGTSNGDEQGNQDIALTLTNNGVGPAILGPVEIRYEGKPITIRNSEAAADFIIDNCQSIAHVHTIPLRPLPQTAGSGRTQEEVPTDG